MLCGALYYVTSVVERQNLHWRWLRI